MFITKGKGHRKKNSPPCTSAISLGLAVLHEIESCITKLADRLTMGVQAGDITDFSDAPNSPALQLYMTQDCTGPFTSGGPDTFTFTGTGTANFGAPAQGSTTCSEDGSTNPIFTVFGFISDTGIIFNDNIQSVSMCPAGCTGKGLLQQ